MCMVAQHIRLVHNGALACDMLFGHSQPRCCSGNDSGHRAGSHGRVLREVQFGRTFLPTGAGLVRSLRA